MTKLPLYVSSRKKIACLLDKAMATVFDREIATLSFVRALIADWLKSRQKRGQRKRESHNYDGQRHSAVRGSSTNWKKIEREREKEREKRGKGRVCRASGITSTTRCNSNSATKYPLFDLFPHLLKWREIQQSCLSGIDYSVSNMPCTSLPGVLFLSARPVPPRAPF